MCGVCATTVRRWVAEGKLSVTRLGRWKFRRAAVEYFLAQREARVPFGGQRKWSRGELTPASIVLPPLSIKRNVSIAVGACLVHNHLRLWHEIRIRHSLFRLVLLNVCEIVLRGL
jgi:excisionase family DNA binding protein